MRTAPTGRRSLLTLSALFISSASFISSVSAAPVLEEVLVTAQKRSESTQDIPVAVTGLSGDSLDKLGFDSAVDIGAQVPNMQVSGAYGEVQPIFSIRGVSMSDYSSNQASPIGVYVDEAYLGPTYSHGASFFDVERLEVLRGPQGTLYGKNTTGGAINIITRTPRFDGEGSRYLKAGAGNFGATTLEAGAEAELIPGTLAARLSGKIKQDDGWMEIKGQSEDGAATDFRGGRLALNWLINDRWDAVFKYTVSKNDGTSTPPKGEGRTPTPDGNDIDYTGYSRPKSLGFHEVESNASGDLNTRTDLSVLTINYNADNYTLTSVSSYLDADYYQEQDTDGGPKGLLEILWASDSQSYSQDLRFTSAFDGMFNIIAGLYYGFEDLAMHNTYLIFSDFPDPRVVLAKPDTLGDAPYLIDVGQVVHRMDVEKESAAAYTQMRFDFTANFGMDIGLRYTRDTNTMPYLNLSRYTDDGEPVGTWVPGNPTGVDNGWIRLDSNSALAILSNPATLSAATAGGYTHGPFTTASAPELESTEKEWTGKIGVDYRFSEEWMAYASYSKGYRAGSFNGGVYYVSRTIDGGAYAAPEYIDAYEVGFKADLLDNSMRLNAAAFYYDYTDQQFINVVGISNFLENAGASSIKGVEAELWARATERLTLQMAVGFLETEFSELSLANTETLDDPDDQVDLSGNELISAPAVNASVSADYDILLTDSGYLSVNANASYQGDQWFSAYNDRNGYGEIRQDAYWLINGRLGWYANDGSYSVSLWGKNLTDEEYHVYALNLQANFGFDEYIAGPPRTYGVEVSYNF
ncbi:TonB-dependent receptor [Litorivivens sp.]|uniref:TonB-dependent receptor n=3 Tax=Litorivivens sp. TaxID=2020868 RepID=UPI0035652AA8